MWDIMWGQLASRSDSPSVCYAERVMLGAGVWIRTTGLRSASLARRTGPPLPVL